MIANPRLPRTHRPLAILRTAIALALCATLACLLTAHAQAAEGKPVRAYINELPKESPEAAAARHARIAKKRSPDHTIIMVHRGASKFYPENSLDAYLEAINRGADGVEIDPRRSTDGVLYSFHDDTADRSLKGASGKMKEKTYYEIASHPLRDGDSKIRVPTLVAFVELARQKDILIHLDVKESGLQEDLIRLFDEADIWDHIVECNGGHADKIRHHQKVKLIPYKGWFPTDKNPDSAANFMKQGGRMVFLKKDPTPAVKYLGRTAPGDSEVPANLWATWYPDGTWQPVESASGK